MVYLFSLLEVTASRPKNVTIKLASPITGPGQSTILLVGAKAATLSLDTARAAHGHEYAGQLSPQKTASFSAL
jgi:hypothetical protein